MDKKITDWKYIGIFLDKMSSDKLRRYLQNPVLKDGIMDGDEWKVYCNHMTLAYNDGSKDVQKIFNYYQKSIGDTRDLSMVAIGASDKAIAAKIDYEDKISNTIAHVTMAVSPTGKPVDSNQITNWLPLEKPVILYGMVAYFGKDKIIHF